MESWQSGEGSEERKEAEKKKDVGSKGCCDFLSWLLSLKEITYDQFSTRWPGDDFPSSTKELHVLLLYVRQGLVEGNRSLRVDSLRNLHDIYCHLSSEFISTFSFNIVLSSPLPCQFPMPSICCPENGVAIPCFRNPKFLFIRKHQTNVCVLHKLVSKCDELLPFWKAIEVTGSKVTCTGELCGSVCKLECKRSQCFQWILCYFKLSKEMQSSFLPSCIYACVYHFFGNM